MTIRSLLILVLLSSPIFAGYIPHIPSDDTIVRYSNDFLGDGGSSEGWVKREDPYDFYMTEISAGSTLDIYIEETGGKLVPGLAIYEGRVEYGDTVGNLGPLLAETNNNRRHNYLRYSWTADEDYEAVIVVSNQKKKTGDYTISVVDPFPRDDGDDDNGDGGNGNGDNGNGDNGNGGPDDDNGNGGPDNGNGGDEGPRDGNGNGAVPEPSSMLAWLTLLLCVGFAGRWRRLRA